MIAKVLARSMFAQNAGLHRFLWATARNSRSAKDRFTTEDSRVTDNDAHGHIANLIVKF